MKYILRHKELKVYLKYLEDLDWNHYVCDATEATVFTNKRFVNCKLKKFKHPDRWEIVEVKDYERHQNRLNNL